MANLVYTAPQTAIVFAPSGGTTTFTPTSLATATGRVSGQHDRGAGSQARRYVWRARTRAGAAPTVGNVVEVYIATGDGTYVDGDLGTTDAALPTAEKRRNLHFIGSIVADVANTTDDFVGSGIIEIQARYLSVVWYNVLGVALSGTAADHSFSLTPIPDEIQ